MTRLFTREDRARMATLDNPLLWRNFCKKMEELNGHLFDPEVVDRSLEPSEALRVLKEQYPDLKTGYEVALLDAAGNFTFTIPTIDEERVRKTLFAIMQATTDYELNLACKSYCNYYEYEQRKYKKAGTQA